MTCPDSRYALRHVDAAGTTHLWTCAPTSAHWVARWHARDSGRNTEVLYDDGAGWRVVTTWTPAGEVPGYVGGWYDELDDDTWDEEPIYDDDSDWFSEHDGGRCDSPGPGCDYPAGWDPRPEIILEVL